MNLINLKIKCLRLITEIEKRIDVMTFRGGIGSWHLENIINPIYVLYMSYSNS